MRLFLLVGLAVGAWGADPDLTGTWRLNHDKSDFGRAARPGTVVTKIRQQGGELRAESTTDGSVSEYRWTLDGKESVNRIRGNEVKAVAEWRGPILQVKVKMTVQGTARGMTDQYSLAGDGKTMTIYRTINGPNGEIEQRYVYDKVPSSN